MYKIYNIEPPYVRCLSIKYLAPLFFPLWLADRHQSYDFLPYVFGRSLNVLVCLRLSVVRTLWLMWNFEYYNYWFQPHIFMVQQINQICTKPLVHRLPFDLESMLKYRNMFCYLFPIYRWLVPYIIGAWNYIYII